MTRGVIECLQERGLIEGVTSPDLAQICYNPIKVYCGFDPTADSLHIGNLVGIVILRWFQKFGHTPVVILGGATGRIGDPSGKSSERPLLDDATITYNVTRIRRHFEAILDFFHKSARPLVMNNDSWFSKFSMIQFLRDVGKHFRVGTMLAKESVKSRLDSEEGISFTELSYQILQAYDFYHLNQEHGVSLQIGGSDQWGNITAGIDLTRKLSAKNAYGLTFPLLTRSDGKKFGKTEGGAIWLSSEKCSPYDFYQYFVRIPDADVIKMMRFLTFMPMEEIHEYEKKLADPMTPPNTAQKKLAEEMTRLIHGEEGLEAALKTTQSAAPGVLAELDESSLKALEGQIPQVALPKEQIVGVKVIDFFVASQFLSSKGEANRLIENKGAYLNNQRVEEGSVLIQDKDLIGGKYLLLGSGKKKKMLVICL